MELEKINKLLLARYRSPDNILGKEYLLKKFPELKSHIRIQRQQTIQHRLVLDMSEVSKYGIAIKPGMVYMFEKEDFPELWEEITKKK